METKNLLSDVKKRLGITDDSRGVLHADQIVPVLKELALMVSNGQYAIGMVLWHADPSPGELVQMAETLDLSPETLKSWITTYSRLRHDAELASLKFSMQQQLARIQNPDDRDALWCSRKPDQWTLADLTQAVNLYMDRQGSGMPKTRQAGCKAKFDDRQMKVNVELAEDAVLLRLAVSEGIKLDNMSFEEESKGVYRVRFTW